jgi:hypothetical protein
VKGVCAAAVALALIACGRSHFDYVDGTVDTGDSLAHRAYIKASNTESNDGFWVVALSADASTLAVGAPSESSGARGVDGDQLDNSVPAAGAVYIFARTDDTWTQQAYLKASNTGVGRSAGDSFGTSLAISADGSTVAVGAPLEDSATAANELDDSLDAAGAVYVFERSGSAWQQQAYIKASNPGLADSFGDAVALSADASILVVGAPLEASASTGVGGVQTNNGAPDAGAVYAFTRSGNIWVQEAYIKASNTNMADDFGSAVALSADGTTLAIGATGEASAASGIDGDEADNSMPFAGAVYVYIRSGTTWTQEAYIKASNPWSYAAFHIVALSANGSTLAVGAPWEDSNGSETDHSASDSGAVYVFTRAGTIWTQHAYLKAPIIDADEVFGSAVALSPDGSTLVVAAVNDDGGAIGIDGDLADRSADRSGAVHMFARQDTQWQHVRYIKPTNTYPQQHFGSGIACSADVSTIVVGAGGEDSAAFGIDGDQSDHSAAGAGAVYAYW